MPNENLHLSTYRVLRYTPNLVRDEWVNVGILLEDPAHQRLAARLAEEPGEIARVRRLHPAADEELLRALPRDLEAEIAAAADPTALLAKLDATLSNVLQFGSPRGVLAEDFDAEMDRLYRYHVAPPPRAGRAAGLLENTRAWIRTRVNAILRRNRILARMERGVRVAEFTQPGDPLRLDYGYRYNGTRGYLHALSLGRDPTQAKVLAFTAAAMRAKFPMSDFTAITEREPDPASDRYQFIVRLLAQEKIEVVPVGRLDAFANRLRPRLQ